VTRIRVSTKVDRRPWYILSRNEVTALRCAAVQLYGALMMMPADLERAVRQIDEQSAYIDGEIAERRRDPYEAAVEREWCP
jgi:hypothetical protein